MVCHYSETGCLATCNMSTLVLASSFFSSWTSFCSITIYIAPWLAETLHLRHFNRTERLREMCNYQYNLSASRTLSQAAYRIWVRPHHKINWGKIWYGLLSQNLSECLKEMADTLSMRHVEQSEQVQAYSDSFTHYFDYLSKQTLMYNRSAQSICGSSSDRGTMKMQKC